MLDGKLISIPYTQIITSTQTVASSKDISVNITRSCSRLQQLYMTMFKTGEENTNLDRMNFNYYYHPMGKGSGGTDGTYDSNKELQFQVQIGAKSIPERPIESVSQTY